MSGQRASVLAICATLGRSAAERALERGEPERDAMVAAYRASRECFLSPSEEEAFIGGTAALVEAFPEREAIVMEEAQALGDFARVIGAAMAGVPVAFDAWDPLPMPEGALGLVELFDASREER